MLTNWFCTGQSRVEAIVEATKEQDKGESPTDEDLMPYGAVRKDAWNKETLLRQATDDELARELENRPELSLDERELNRLAEEISRRLENSDEFQQALQDGDAGMARTILREAIVGAAVSKTFDATVNHGDAVFDATVEVLFKAVESA